MSLFAFFRHPDINQGIKDYQKDPGAVLLDVRTPQEYKEGHIPGSRNVPLLSVSDVETVVKSKDTALYVYCYSGSRSRQASHMLKRLGYTNVNDIGGIAAYRGKVDR